MDITSFLKYNTFQIKNKQKFACFLKLYVCILLKLKKSYKIQSYKFKVWLFLFYIYYIFNHIYIIILKKMEIIYINKTGGIYASNIK